MALATSSGVPSRCSGCRQRTISGVSSAALIAVLMLPGATQFTRIPCSARSMAIDLVKCTTAAFAARYGMIETPGLMPAIGDVCALEGGRLAEIRGQCLAGLVVDVGDDDAGAFLNEQLGGGPSDAVGSAGDDRDLPAELRTEGHVPPANFIE